MTGWGSVQGGCSIQIMCITLCLVLPIHQNLKDVNLVKESKVVCPARRCNFEAVSSLNCLAEHCREVHKWKEVPCSFDNCNFVAYSDSSNSAHRVFFHSKHRSFAPKSFPCNWVNCKSTFSFSSGLKKHMRIHTNNLLECVFCPYRTNEVTELKNHYRSHFKMCLFKCQICNRKYISKKELNDHFAHNHSEDNHTCHICKVFSGTRKKLQRHIKNTHKLLTKWNDTNKTFDTFSRE